MHALHTHLRVPYDTCARHISKNLRKTLQVHIIRQDKPDTVDILPLESIRNIEIVHIEHETCNDIDCLHGNMVFNGNPYRFTIHQRSYNVVLIMEKTAFPFAKMRMVLPITSYKGDRNMIYIPPEYTHDEKVIPIEFVWEFLSQLSTFVDSGIEIDI